MELEYIRDALVGINEKLERIATAIEATSKANELVPTPNSAMDAISVLDKFESIYNLSAEAKITVDLVRQFALLQHQ